MTSSMAAPTSADCGEPSRFSKEHGVFVTQLCDGDGHAAAGDFAFKLKLELTGGGLDLGGGLGGGKSQDDLDEDLATGTPRADLAQLFITIEMPGEGAKNAYLVFLLEGPVKQVEGRVLEDAKGGEQDGDCDDREAQGSM